jgi:hypothetical protein
MERLVQWAMIFSGLAMWFLIAYALYETAGTGVFK